MNRLYPLLATIGAIILLTSLAACQESAASTATSGPVTLQAGAASYGPHDTIAVTVSNAGAAAISFPDHQTNCSVILLQRQVNESWEAVNACRVLTPTRLYTLAAGQRLTVRLTPVPGQPWLPGRYRAALSYRADHTAGPPTPVYSASLQVS
jgi:hypothetical protein